MSRGRVAAVLAFGIAGSQAGHLLAYGLRFGDAALSLQSSGPHAYFPLLARTVLGAVALIGIASVLLVGFARLATGRRMERDSAPPFVRLLAVVYTIQLAVFIAQETIEGSPAGQVILWGLVAQLPVAALGALALRWLLATLRPALDHLRVSCQPAFHVLPMSAARVLRIEPARVPVARASVAGSITRRGPPSF